MRETPPKTALWVGTAVTATAAILFPKIESIKNNDEPLWRLAVFFVPGDREGLLLVPLVIVLAIALFALVGGWAWKDTDARNRPAKVGLICAVLGLVGVLAFFLSAPIILGGLAVTLGLEGRRRSATEGRATQALAAISVGSIAFAVGAAIWVLA